MAKPRNFCRFICVIITLVVLLIIAGVAAFILWARPPAIDYQGVIPPADQSKSFVLKDAPNFTFNIRLNITVDNPNYVGATLNTIDGTGSLPIDGEPQLGSGQMKDVKIDRRAKTTILFPVEIAYNVLNDKDLSIIKYIATKCGLLSEKQTRSPIQIKYAVTTSVKVVAINVDLPTFNGEAEFDCPIPPGTKIPGLDILLQVASGKLPGNLNPQQIIQQAQNQASKFDLSAVNNVKNMIGTNLPDVAQIIK